MNDISSHIEALARLLAPGAVVTAEAIAEAYTHDETEDLRGQPVAVLFPSTVEEVSAVLRYCHAHRLPLTPRGAGSGLAGGAIPPDGGLLLSLERLNRIVWLDERSLQVCVEPGVITGQLQEWLQERGLFYPPDPASRSWSFIGGNVSTNAGGPRAVKYGVVRDYVLNLEVVLPGGEVIWTGANTLKNSTGYNLTHLFTGSEGTLGVITKIVLRLIPYPTHRRLLLANFEAPEAACEAVSAIFRAGITPSALEFMERSALLRAAAYLGNEAMPVPDNAAAQLLIEIDGFYPELLEADCARITEVLDGFGCGEVMFADTAAAQDRLWRMRRCIGHATKQGTIYKEEDTVVPRAELAALLRGVKAIGSRYGFESVCYGHAGDGNLHVNILRGNLGDEAWQTQVPQGIREIFELVRSLGGMLSGEHGVGLVQRPYLDQFFPPHHLALFRSLKKVFDPHGILNPGKGAGAG